MDLDKARSHIAELFTQCDGIPKSARIFIREDAPNQTTVLHCDWILEETTPSRKSRLITLQLTRLATQMFLDANKATLLTLDKSLQRIVRNRLKNVYKETDSQDGPFIIFIGDVDLN